MATTDLNPVQRTALADHLRALDRSEIAAWGASSPDAFYAAINALTTPSPLTVLALEHRLIRPQWMQCVGAKSQMGYTLNGTGRDFIARHRAAKPAAVVPIRRDRGPARLPVREPLMGERLLVAELAKAA